MQDFIPGVFATIVVVAFLCLIIGPIAPSLFRFGRPQRPSRKRIFFVALATLIASFVGFGMTMPEPTPEQKALAEQAAKERADQAAKSKADAEVAAKAEEERKAATAKTQAELVAKTKADADDAANAKTAKLHEAIVQLWAKIGELGQECESGRKETATALSRGDRYRAYEKASAASTACKMANFKVSMLPIPSGLSSELKAGLQKAVQTCSMAYFMKKQALDSMLTVIDGDARPSAVNAVKEASNSGNIVMMQCAAQYLAAGHAAGVPLANIASGNTDPEKGRTFFPTAASDSVARCSAEGTVFDGERTADQAKEVEAACQTDANAAKISKACRDYANQMANAAYKFRRSMESKADRAKALGEEMRAHIGRAQEAANGCNE